MNDLAIFKNILSKYKIWHLFRKAYKDRIRISCEIERYDMITLCMLRNPKQFFRLYSSFHGTCSRLYCISYILHTILPEIRKYYTVNEIWKIVDELNTALAYETFRNITTIKTNN